MTKKQKKLYDFILRYMSKNGIAPNFDEMIAYMKLSPKSKGSIFAYLTALESEKLILCVLIKTLLTSILLSILKPDISNPLLKPPAPQKRSSTFLFSKSYKESKRDFFTLD